MTREEIIANKQYHTCGRCKWDCVPDDMSPCSQCKHGFDPRKDLWEYKEESEAQNEDSN